MIGQLLLVRGCERDAPRRFLHACAKMEREDGAKQGRGGMRIRQGCSRSWSRLHGIAHAHRNVKCAAA